MCSSVSIHNIDSIDSNLNRILLKIYKKLRYLASLDISCVDFQKILTNGAGEVKKSVRFLKFRAILHVFRRVMDPAEARASIFEIIRTNATRYQDARVSSFLNFAELKTLV